MQTHTVDIAPTIEREKRNVYFGDDSSIRMPVKNKSTELRRDLVHLQGTAADSYQDIGRQP